MLLATSGLAIVGGAACGGGAGIGGTFGGLRKPMKGYYYYLYRLSIIF